MCMNDEERYCITPKGLLYSIMVDLGWIRLGNVQDGAKFESCWVLFDHYMRKHGYIEDQP